MSCDASPLFLPISRARNAHIRPKSAPLFRCFYAACSTIPPFFQVGQSQGVPKHVNASPTHRLQSDANCHKAQPSLSDTFY